MLIWEAALPASFALPDDEIHLWRVPLTSVDLPFERILSPAELEQAARFKFEPPRQKFRVHRCALRLVLSRYLGTQPSEVEYQVGEKGKPFVVLPRGAMVEPVETQPPETDPLNGILPRDGGSLRSVSIRPEAHGATRPSLAMASDLEFSASHSGGYALYAIGRRQMGVDIEQVQPKDDLLRIAERFFAPAESAQLQALPPVSQVQAFYHTWTQKEAFVKALGLGLSYSLERFVVDADPAHPGGLLAWEDGDRDAWQFAAFLPAPGYRGALFYDGASAKIRAFGMTINQLL